MKKILFATVLAFGLASFGFDCQPPPSPKPTPTPHPATPQDTADCAAACANLARLGCPEAKDVLTGNGSVITCVQWCTAEQQDNAVELNPSCVKTITSCVQLETQCAVGRLR